MEKIDKKELQDCLERIPARIKDANLLHINVFPPEAKIWVDDTYVGEGLVVLRFLPFTKHKIRIEQEHYITLVDEINFRKALNGKSLNFKLSLKEGYEQFFNHGFIRNNLTGVIYDKTANLEWLVGPDEDCTWDNAKKVISSLKDTWRFPSREELRQLDLREIDWKNWGPFLNSGWWVWIEAENSDKSRRSCYPFLPGFSTWHGKPSSSNMTRWFAVRDSSVGKHLSNRISKSRCEVPNTLDDKILSLITVNEEEAKLLVSSIPEGADVFIDNAYYGKTPLFLKEIPALESRFLLLHSVFQHWEEDVAFSSTEEKYELEATMLLHKDWKFVTEKVFQYRNEDIFYELTSKLTLNVKYKELTYADAKNWVEELQGNWRLPTIRELQLLKKSGLFDTSKVSFFDCYPSLYSSNFCPDENKVEILRCYGTGGVKQIEVNDWREESVIAVSEDFVSSLVIKSEFVNFPPFTIHSGNKLSTK